MSKIDPRVTIEKDEYFFRAKFINWQNLLDRREMQNISEALGSSVLAGDYLAINCMRLIIAISELRRENLYILAEVERWCLRAALSLVLMKNNE